MDTINRVSTLFYSFTLFYLLKSSELIFRYLSIIFFNHKIMTQENLQNDVNQSLEKINTLINEVHKKVVGQENLIQSLIIWLLTKWHILLEWVPGLAKTLTISSLSKTLDLGFSRVQFTPDLLPSDLIWTEIYNPKAWIFETKLWPIFNNFILADEINRAPSKVQSALLEAMAEKQITIWNKSYQIDSPFIVLATQNPVEQSWTYKLPEAQLDRFLLKTKVWYPHRNEEIEMYKKLNSKNNNEINTVLNKKDLEFIQNVVEEIYVSDNIFEYVYNIIEASRNTKKYDLNELNDYILYWISPRWWLALINASKVIALLNWRTFVIPEDVKAIAIDALAHRIVLTYEALANDITPEEVISKIISKINIV